MRRQGQGRPCPVLSKLIGVASEGMLRLIDRGQSHDEARTIIELADGIAAPPLGEATLVLIDYQNDIAKGR